MSAKSLLDSNLEETLSLVEGLLKSAIESNNEDSLHPSLGPLYYLYGTTLLYIVEESTETAGMMAPEDQQTSAEESEVDKEAAWENLESARTIIEKIVSEHELKEELKKMIELDLALVYSRLGDLAKANGHFKDCLGDYGNTLRLRMKHMGKYCQKTSDAYYSLATAYTNLAAGEEDSDEAKSTDAEKKAWNLDSIRQYYECGLCFSGMAAEMVNEDPTFKKILSPSDSNEDDDDDDDDDDEEETLPARAAAETNPHATKLQSVKKQLESFKLFVAPPARPATEDEAAKDAWDEDVKKQKAAYSDEQDQFMFCYEMLEEMIECVESADKNMEVLQKARENKEKAEGAEGSTDGTTIGFGDAGAAAGGAAVAEGAGQTTFGFGAAPTTTAAAAAPVAAAPMMVVTKKKKKTVAPTPVAGEGEQGDAKKQRVE